MTSKESIVNKDYLTLLKQVEKEHKKKDKYSLNINDRVLVIDFLNTFIRAFTANPALSENGAHIGGLIGFLKSIRFALAKIKPTRCIIVFDGKHSTKRRQKIYPSYKNERRVKERFNRNINLGTSKQGEKQSMKTQLGRLVKYLEQLPVTLVSIDGIEADDIMAYISKQLLKDSDIFLMSTDKDFLQLIDNRIKVWSPTKKIIYDIKKIKEEYNIYPKNFLLYRVLDGDKSDNIKGIRGAGLTSLKKYIPRITEENEFNVRSLIKFVESSDKKLKLFENIKNNQITIKRNYLLMQLHNVDISNRQKLLIQESIRRKVPQLIKYKFSTLFIQDKLWSQIPDMDSWITEFIRLDRYRELIKNE